MKNNENYRIKNLLVNQKGMALLATLIFVMVIVSLSVALLTMTSNDSKLSTLQRESNNAFYLAESGIEKTFYNLNVDDGYDMVGEEAWRPGDTHPIFSEGTTEERFEVTIANIGSATPPEEVTDRIKIISTGIVDMGEFSSGKRKIEVIAEIDFLLVAMYKYAALSERVIILNGTPGAAIDGDIHSNDAIEVQGQFDEFYEGTATVGGDNNEVYDEDELIDGFNINGDIIPVPTINYDGTGDEYSYEDSLLAEAFAQESAEGIIHVHEGPVDLDNGDVLNWTGVHYIKGDLTAKNGSSIFINNGVIVVEGAVDIRYGATFEHTKDDDYISPFSHLALVATGDILLHAEGSIVGGVVQSIEKDGTSTGTIDFRNGSTVVGAVIAQTIMMHNNTNIIYDEEGLGSITSQGDGFYKKVSWQEIYD